MDQAACKMRRKDRLFHARRTVAKRPQIDISLRAAIGNVRKPTSDILACKCYLDDPWPDVLQYSLDSRNFVEDVYRVDLRGGFKNKDDKEARELVYKRIAAGAAFLRDLAYTAWIDSAKPLVKPIDEPENPENPRYNPAASSAPAPEHSH